VAVVTVAGARNARPEVPHWATGWLASFSLFLEAGGKSRHTVSRYTDAPGWLAGWLAPRHPTVGDWDQVTHEHIKTFLVYLQEAGYSTKYVHNIGAAVAAFWAWWAVEEDLPNPMMRVAVPAAPKLGSNPPPVIELEQLEALLKDAERGRDFESRRDAAFVRMFASTGVRLSELTNLVLDDVNLSKREMIVTGKGGKTRRVRFDRRCALALDRYIRVRSKHKHADLPGLWLAVRRSKPISSSGVQQAIRRRGEALGLRLHPHLFRHTFCHRWLVEGGAEGDLEEFVGWDSSQMLRLYGRSARAERARTAYDRIDVMGGI
jgi:integrase/recombinase XerD